MEINHKVGGRDENDLLGISWKSGFGKCLHLEGNVSFMGLFEHFRQNVINNISLLLCLVIFVNISLNFMENNILSFTFTSKPKARDK